LMSKLSKLNEENLKILNEQIQSDLRVQINNVKFEKQDINIDGILSAIFQSNRFEKLFNDNLKTILTRLDQHDNEISSIKLDLSNLRDEVVSKFSVINEDVKLLSSALNNFDDELKLLKIENVEKVKEILLMIDEKIKTSSESQFPSIDFAVKQNVLKLFGYKDSKFDEESLKDWISGIFVARDYLEERLKSLEINKNQNVQIQIDRSSEALMNDITKKINNEINIAFTNKVKDLETSRSSSTSIGALNENDIIKIVKDVLKVYDADKTGLVDFALETAGGQVISTRCTETYRTKSAEISIFGIPLWYPSNTPRTVISPSVHPGECWAFQGFPGFLVVQLNNLVEITGFTIEHIPKSLAPNGIIDSAPKNFSVWVS
jgi:SUN domain-containing protein 1/2